MSSEKSEPKILLAERAVFVGVVDGLLDALETERELAAHEDEDRRDLQRVGRDDDALDQLVRIALEQQVVLERRRLGLVTVHHEVRDRGLAQHRPLATGRETGAAATRAATPGRPRWRRPRGTS